MRATIRRVRLVERVREGARALEPRAALANVAAAIPYVLAWLIGLLFRGVWLCVAWVWTAVELGFREGRGGRRE